MIKYFISVLALTFIVIVILTSPDSNCKIKISLDSEQYFSNITERVQLSKTDTSRIPEDIEFPSNVGEVSFPHQFHIDDLELECVECHHQINAKILVTPHADYFKSSWINCEICHNESGQIEQKIFTCSECHHPGPENIADETLSSKVVIHKNCWNCHEVGTGVEASATCNGCHSGEKTES